MEQTRPTAPGGCQGGAVCANPASPELTLLPSASVDKWETEVNGGILSYALALSARPEKSVRITITKENEREVDCIRYEDGLDLRKNVFDFNSTNYNISQTVEIVVDRNSTKYEGTSRAYFSHNLESDDSVWTSASLRSMFVTIVDDSPCTEGSQQYDKSIGSSGTQVRVCGCREGYFIQEVDSANCNSVVRCGKCPEGMTCAFQQELHTAEIEPQFYRIRENSTNVVECPLPHACVGNGTHGDALCKEGHQGPFCMVCKLGDTERYVKSGDACTKCDNDSIAGLCLAATGIGLLCLGSVLFLARRRKKRGDRYETMTEFADRVQTKYKVVFQ